MKLAYRAYDNKGREVREVIEAADAAEATKTLRCQDLFVAEISQAGNQAGQKTKHVRLRGGKSRRLKKLALFTRQLYVLVSSGTPLAQSLSALERQARNPGWQEVIGEIRTRLEHGSSLSEAMASHPECFDSVYRSMVAVGESSGDFAGMLDRLASLVHKRVRIRSTIKGAMVYPCLLVTVSMVVMTVLLLLVIPRFKELFETLDVPLPPTTALLISLSEMLRSYWWAMGGILAAVIVTVHLWLKTTAGKRAVDTLVLRLPQIGRIVKNFATARIARLLGVLMDSQLPVLEALRLTRGALANVHYAELIARTEQAVEKGEPISSTFADTDLISPSVYEATRSGERSGQVAALLLNLADFLDEENEIVVRSLTSILEPAVLIVMGALVAFVALSMFTPLFDITAMAGGGA